MNVVDSSGWLEHCRDLSGEAQRQGLTSHGDAIILSMASASGAILWTQGANFEGLTDVKYVSARSD